jgi:hypothetical protein
MVIMSICRNCIPYVKEYTFPKEQVSREYFFGIRHRFFKYITKDTRYSGLMEEGAMEYWKKQQWNTGIVE